MESSVVFRLKAVDSVLSGVESMKQVVADFEIALVSQDTMTSDPLTLHQLREELQVIVTSHNSSKFHPERFSHMN